MSDEAWLEVGPGYMPRTELTNITIQGVWKPRLQTKLTLIVLMWRIG